MPEATNAMVSVIKYKISGILFDGKRLLHLSLFSLMESMRTDPHRYSRLIYYNVSSSARNNIVWLYTGYNYTPRQQTYSSFDGFYDEYKSTLLEEAEKLYNKTVRGWTEKIIKEYSIKDDDITTMKGRQQQSCYKPSNRLSLPIAISDNQALHIKWSVLLEQNFD